MNRYQPPFTINNTMLIYVSSISEKLGRISMLQKMESRPYLRRNNRIKSIHSSLKIEANSLSLGQVRDVLAGHMVLGEQKEIQEVKNAYAAYEKLPEINPYSLKDLKKLHGVMTQYTVDESGVFRKGEEGVFNGDKCIFIAPPARLVPGLMEELFDWMSREQASVHPLILSSVFHYEFVFIHPFSDGNGRWQGCGIRRFFPNGNRFLSTSRLKVRLKNFRMVTIRQLPNVIQKGLPISSLNLCSNRLIWFLMISPNRYRMIQNR